MSVTVNLTHPIQHAGQTLNSLSFRSPKVSDLIAASEETTPVRQTMGMLARLCGLDFATFGEIDAADLSRIVEATGELLGNEQSTETGAG